MVTYNDQMKRDADRRERFAAEQRKDRMDNNPGGPQQQKKEHPESDPGYNRWKAQEQAEQKGLPSSRGLGASPLSLMRGQGRLGDLAKQYQERQQGRAEQEEVERKEREERKKNGQETEEDKQNEKEKEEQEDEEEDGAKKKEEEEDPDEDIKQAAQELTAHLLRLAWGWLIPTIGLTIFYINFHYSQSKNGGIFPKHYFVQFGHEWTEEFKIPMPLSLLGLCEIVAMIFVDAVLAILVLIWSMLFMLMIYAVINPVDMIVKIVEFSGLAGLQLLWSIFKQLKI